MLQVQATVCMEKGSTQTNPLLLSSTKNASTSTDDLYAMIPFCIEAIQDDDKAVLFHTGFPSYMLLMICFNFLGPETSVLSYQKSLVTEKLVLWDGIDC